MSPHFRVLLLGALAVLAFLFGLLYPFHPM